MSPSPKHQTLNLGEVHGSSNKPQSIGNRKRSAKVYLYTYFFSKTKMCVAGLIFEPNPPTFKDLYNSKNP